MLQLQTTTSSRCHHSYQSRLNAKFKSGLPTCVREHLASQRMIQVARILDVLYLHCDPSNPVMTRTQIFEICQEFCIGHNEVEAALKSKLLTEWGDYPIFKTVHPDEPDTRRFSSPAFDPNTPNRDRVQKQGEKSRRGRPPKSFVIPDPYRLCNLIGKLNALQSDPLLPTDMKSLEAYRMAMHRQLIESAPGQYSLAWLARRIGVCKQTIRNYNERLGITVKPRKITVARISLSSLDSLSLHESGPRGVWLEDGAGKKYPPIRNVAERLLRFNNHVSLRKQGANYYCFR